MSQNPPPSVEGACFCGRVRFELRLPTRFIANCHCSECRRAQGAAFVTWAGVPEKQFRLLTGEAELPTYEYPEAARQFCRTCGSPLFFRGERWPEEVHVTRASLPEALDRDVQADVFFSDKASWHDPERKLPRYGGATGTENLN